MWGEFSSSMTMLDNQVNIFRHNVDLPAEEKNSDKSQIPFILIRPFGPFIIKSLSLIHI